MAVGSISDDSGISHARLVGFVLLIIQICIYSKQDGKKEQ
jgi:hypothetical protein